MSLTSELLSCSELGPVGGSPEPGEIDAVEASLGCKFSSDYRSFLTTIGAAIVGSQPIYGVRPIAYYQNDGTVSDVTEGFRADGWPLCESRPVISVDGGGNPIVEDQSGKILTYDHDFGGEFVVAIDFATFIEKLMHTS